MEIKEDKLRNDDTYLSDVMSRLAEKYPHLKTSINLCKKMLAIDLR